MLSASWLLCRRCGHASRTIKKYFDSWLLLFSGLQTNLVSIRAVTMMSSKGSLSRSRSPVPVPMNEHTLAAGSGMEVKFKLIY